MNSHKNTIEGDERSKLSYYIKDAKMINLLNNKGIIRLLPVQYQTFPLIYKGMDIIAKDRTGSGKTLAFTIPVVQKMRQMKKFTGFPTLKFLIVLPTRQLAIQVRDQINSVRYRNEDDFVVSAIYGGAGVQDQLRLLSKGVDIIVGTPGRIIDFIERKAIKLNTLEVLCLDQADEMLNIGFKQDIQKIFKYITWSNKQKIQCLMFSATIPDWIWKMSNLYQSKDRKFIDMIQDDKVKTSKTVEHCCLYADQWDKQYAIGPLIHYFLNQKYGRILVFCDTKKDVERIGTPKLIPTSVGTLHGDYSQYQRQRVFHDFKNGNLECLVATNVAARGLDFPQIDLIIQLSPPSTTDAYIHRSGRTGRAGKSGICVTLYDYKQEHLMGRIQKQAKIIFQHLNPQEVWEANINYNRAQQYEQKQPKEQQQCWDDIPQKSIKQPSNSNYRSPYPQPYVQGPPKNRTNDRYDRKYQDTRNYKQSQNTNKGPSRNYNERYIQNNQRNRNENPNRYRNGYQSKNYEADEQKRNNKNDRYQ